MLDHTRSEKLAGDKYSSLLGAPVSYKEVVNTAPEWALINFILRGLPEKKIGMTVLLVALEDRR
jgi:hypothetical protein